MLPEYSPDDYAKRRIRMFRYANPNSTVDDYYNVYNHHQLSGIYNDQFTVQRVFKIGSTNHDWTAELECNHCNEISTGLYTALKNGAFRCPNCSMVPTGMEDAETQEIELPVKHCAQCGTEFTSMTTRRRFCSVKCKGRWHKDHDPKRSSSHQVIQIDHDTSADSLMALQNAIESQVPALEIEME